MYRYGEVTKSVLVCDPRVETFSREHLPYAIMGMLLFIRKYGSTFYIGIAMVVFPYIGPWEN